MLVYTKLYHHRLVFFYVFAISSVYETIHNACLGVQAVFISTVLASTVKK